MALELEDKESPYEECVSHAEEALLVITNDRLAFTAIEELQQQWTRIKALQEKANLKIEKDIEALQNLIAECEDPDVQAELTEREKKLTDRCEEVDERLNQVIQECEQFKEKVKEEEKEREINKKALLDVNKHKNYSLPKAKYNVNIYSNISNIRWQLNSTEDEIKGYVSKNKDVQPFSLSAKKHSKHFITNYLWDLMEEDW